MLQSRAILYVENALVSKIKYDKIISELADKNACRSPTVYNNRLLGLVRSTGIFTQSALVSCLLQTVQLHREPNKYVVAVLSDNFTTGE